MFKLWIDDIREAPKDYNWAKTVNETIYHIEWWEKHCSEYDTEGILLDIDHDAGIFYSDGGDYIKILDWLEWKNPNYPITIHIHSMNPVGAQNMRQIIKKNGWREI